MTQTTPTRDEAFDVLAKQITAAASDMCEIARIAGEWRNGPKQSLTAIREIRAVLASAPAPASGGVAAIAKIIDPEGFKLLAEGNNLTTGQAANYRDAYGKAHLILASLSPAATPVSEADGDVLADSRLDMAWADGAKAAMNAMADFLPDAPAVREMDRIIAQRQADAIAGRALAKPAASPAPVRPIGNQGISDYQREIARNMAEGFAAWNAARQEALPSDEPASSPAGSNDAGA